jgi:hypothetical protein
VSGDKHTEGMFAAAALLESYLRQVQSIEGNLREADENIDTVREVRMLMVVGASHHCEMQREVSDARRSLLHHISADIAAASRLVASDGRRQALHHAVVRCQRCGGMCACCELCFCRESPMATRTCYARRSGT